MITIRRGDSRGRSRFDRLDSRHTFSFGDYYDPQHMGFSDLRVMNEDRVAPGKGFGTHSHRDMEIITYVSHSRLCSGRLASFLTTFSPDGTRTSTTLLLRRQHIVANVNAVYFSRMIMFGLR
jgi:Pirin